MKNVQQWKTALLLWLKGRIGAFKYPVGKYPVGKYPVGKYPQPVVTKG
jgi:hypothetical protein